MYSELLKYRELDGKNELQIINLGTGMGYYDFCYDDISIPSFNFSLPQQTLQFDYKILLQYHTKCRTGCKVCIVLPYCIFCANHFDELDEIYDRYYSILPVSEVEGHCSCSYIEYLKKSENNKICKPAELTKPLSSDEAEMQSREAVLIWQRQLPIVSCQSGEITDRASEEMSESKKWLKKILELCRLQQFIPIIIVPPMSNALLDKISREFREAYFYNQLYEVIGDTVTVLDYTENKMYGDYGMYGWPGFLIKDAAKKFTKDVINKIFDKRNLL